MDIRASHGGPLVVGYRSTGFALIPLMEHALNLQPGVLARRSGRPVDWYQAAEPSISQRLAQKKCVAKKTWRSKLGEEADLKSRTSECYKMLPELVLAHVGCECRTYHPRLGPYGPRCQVPEKKLVALAKSESRGQLTRNEPY